MQTFEKWQNLLMLSAFYRVKVWDLRDIHWQFLIGESSSSIDNVRHCRYCVSHHASREFQYSCFIFLSKLTRFLLWVLYFVASCVTWVTLLYSDSCVTWHLNLYLNLYYVRILLCHVRGSVQGNVQCRVPRKINKKNNVLQ